MSVRAYRTGRTEAESETFDLWHDEKLMDYLNEKMQFLFDLNSYGTGTVSISVSLLEGAVNAADDFELDSFTVTCLQRDIAQARSVGDDAVFYDCF